MHAPRPQPTAWTSLITTPMCLVATCLSVLAGLLAVAPVGAQGPTCAGESATIIGTAGVDLLRGTPGRDVIVGLGGDDVLIGAGGDDVICGGAGTDRLVGNAGGDLLIGGWGDDLLIGGVGPDVLRGGPGADTLRGGDGNDDLRGDEGNDLLYGEHGGDRLTGNGGHDRLFGGLRNDELFGGPGNDELRGGWGDDVLTGGWGNDLLGGSRGFDRCSPGRRILCEAGLVTIAPPTTTTVPPTTTTRVPATTTTTTLPPVTRSVLAYDSAWETPTLATLDEADEYFQHLQDRGYDGVLLSLLNHTVGSINGRNVNGDRQAEVVDGTIVVSEAHLAHMRAILDLAHDHELRVGFVPVWGAAYLNTAWWDEQCLDGPLTAENAGALGTQLGREIGNHEAIEFWIMGGDNLCHPLGEIEDVAVWRSLVSALRAEGVAAQTTFHPVAGNLSSNHKYRNVSRFAEEDWVDFLFPQTGHCEGGQVIADLVERLQDDFDKDVFLSESRYYEAGSDDWCRTQSSTNRIDATDIWNDVRAAVDAGVIGAAYGDWNRWKWCRPSTSGRLPYDDPCGEDGIAITLDTPGEDAFFAALEHWPIG